jgi:hypothetical protein
MTLPSGRMNARFFRTDHALGMICRKWSREPTPSNDILARTTRDPASASVPVVVVLVIVLVIVMIVVMVIVVSITVRVYAHVDLATIAPVAARRDR